MKFLTYLITGLIFHTSSGANTTEKNLIDSLIQVSVTADNDTIRFEALNRLTWHFQNEPEKEKIYAKKALELAAEINYDKGLANIHFTLGAINYGRANYLKALEHYFHALKISEKINYMSSVAAILTNIGIIYYDQGNYPKALEYYFKALNKDEELGRKPSIARDFNNIGNIYLTYNDYHNALKFYFKAIETFKELGLKQEHAISINNIGEVYHKQGDYPKALDYYFKALKMAEELGNNYLIAIWLGNIGFVYTYQADYPKALEYYFKALKISKEIGAKNSIASTLGYIGSLYTKTGRFTEAEAYLDSTLVLSDSIGALNYTMEFEETITHLYDTLAQLVAKGQTLTGFGTLSGLWQKAYEHHKKYSAAKDSIFNEEKSKEIGKLEASHEYEKQIMEQEKEHEKQQALAAAELKRQRIIAYSFIGGFGLVLILAFVIYRSFRQKQQANIIITQQKEEVEKQKAIVDTKNKDITDSIRYAQNIQEAILPDKEDIQKALPGHFIYFQPRDIVSGDFYWFRKQNGKIHIAVCDCTGHGVPGAFVSMIGNDLMNQIIIEKGIEDPGEILTRLNNGVKSVFTREGHVQQAKDGMDMVLCVFDKGLKTLEFAGANNPLFLIQNGELKLIKGDKYAIGGDTEIDYNFTNYKTTLQKGDTIYMFSDGYQDQFGGNSSNKKFGEGKKFMKKHIKELLLSIHDKSMQEQKEIIHKTITDWKGGLSQVDDICVIGIRV